MSYILDALRRADAERELGEVPTLHTQEMPLASSDDGFDAPPAPSWRWVGVILGLLTAGAATWFLMRPDASAPTSAVVLTAPAVQPVAQAPVPSPPLPQLAPTAALLAEKASELQAQPPATRSQPVAAPDALQKKAPNPVAGLAASAGSPKTTTLPVSPRTESKSTAKVAAAAALDAVGTLNDLPEAIRREQPKLSVSGAMHSANPANRMLILNGQVFHEGDQVTTDLVLEQIKLKSAVLVYKGYRYSINY
ncbi:MAG: GspB domain-containing protein [Rhizobacter sp.]